MATRKVFATLYASKRTGRSLPRGNNEFAAIFSISYRKCGCVDPRKWSARTIVIAGTNRTIEAPLCKLSDECHQAANLEFLNSSSLIDEYCSDCTQACSSVDYIVTPSSVPAPHPTLAAAIKNLLEQQGVALVQNWNTDWQSEVTNNYVGLEVVCQSLLVENVTQQPLIGAVDVLSNVGGQAGLWIGISFLSIMEFIEMFTRLVRSQFQAIRARPRRKTNGGKK